MTAFLKERYSQAALVTRGAETRDPARDLYCDARFAKRAFLRDVDAARRGPNGHEQWRIDSAQIDAELARGHTICGDVSSGAPIAAALRALSADLGTGPGGFAKLYVSPRGAGFGMHLDRDHVFVVQLEGEKKWEYSETPAMPHAVRNGVRIDGRATYAGGFAGVPMPAREVSFAEVVLRPGDVLYLPPGTWHQATAVSARALAVSLSPPRVTPYEIVMQVLDQLALTNPEWHRDLAPGATRPRGKGVFEDALADVTRSMTKSLTDLAPSVLSRAHLLATLSTANAITEPAASTPLTGNTLLRAREPLGFLTLPDSIVVYGAGREVVFPLGALRFVRALVSAGTFSVAEAEPWHALTGDDHLALLDELRAVGLLELAGC